MDISDEDLLNDDSVVVPNSVPENFSSQLVTRLGIKSLTNAQAETAINNTTVTVKKFLFIMTSYIYCDSHT